MASTDHDLLLGRVLPHVQKGVINEAQRTIIECDWDEFDEDQADSDSLDYELDPRLRSMTTTTTTRQSRTNSTSDFSYLGALSGGLSPPRRFTAFADFDSSSAVGSGASNEMADIMTLGGACEHKQQQQQVGGGMGAPLDKHVTTSFAGNVPIPVVGEPMDGGNSLNLPVSRSRASSLRNGRRLSGAHSPAEPPPRSSSSRVDKSAEPNGLTAIALSQSQGQPHAAAATDKPLPPLVGGTNHVRANNTLILRSNEDEEGEEGEEGEEDDLDLTSKDPSEYSLQRNGYVTSAQHQQGLPPPLSYGRSSTPPPIANVRPAPRMVVYDEFEEEDPLRGFEDPNPAGSYYETNPNHSNNNNVHNNNHDRQKPPSSHARRVKEPKFDSLSLSSDRSRTTATGGIQQHNMHSARMAPLAANYRDLRTPVLDHVQLYHDAESKKPLFDPTVEGRAAHQRATTQKVRRFHDDSGTMMYSNGNGNHHINGNGHHMNGTNNTNHNNNNNNNMVPGTSSSSSGGGGVGVGDVDQFRYQGVPLRRAYSDDEVSMRHSISGKTTASMGSSNMPDFFTTGIFQVVLHNPTTAYRLLKFSESRLCAENVEFLSRVDAYRTALNGLASQMSTIHKTYISPGSPSQINVNGTLLKRAHRDMRSLVTTALPQMENLFTDLQEQIETLVFQDVYPRFVRHQMALSASRALGSDRFKYQGLGDCFCLTNPNVADNPIVFASDGFVKVTGYTRPEIVPRNCRFLQGAHTDRQAVNRVRTAIYEQKESVELLLNYKKNGDPFWNLLYVVPLFNQRGKCEFFLGGQVNCSTTIHSNVDVMKVLSLSDTPETEDVEAQQRNGVQTAAKPVAARPSARRTFLKALGVRQDDHPPLPTGEAGMENGLLGRMEGQDLSNQMKEFYTAYSKFLIVRASTWTIEFYSDGVVEALNPANMASSMVAGSDVFRFLGLHMLSKQADYKMRVRNAIRAGAPVSTALRLQTKRSAIFRGDEPFVAHWTPMKDEKAAVHWIAVTLAPMTF